MANPLTPPTRNQLELLHAMMERGVMIVGVLGADARHPNQRIYFTSEGETINPKYPGHGYLTVNGMLARNLVKVISTSGEDPPRLKHLTITEAGRREAERLIGKKRAPVARGSMSHRRGE